MIRDIIRSKVAIIGDDKIGKSKLLSTFINGGSDDEGQWDNNYSMTIEMDLEIVTINIPDTNYAVELQIFDFGGNHLFNVDNDIRRKYFQLTDHVIAAYNISNRRTFDSLNNIWIKEYKAAKNTSNKYSGIILGLQSDLSTYTVVNPKEAIKLATESNFVAMSCSAKNNNDIDIPFNYLAQQVYLQHIGNNENEGDDKK